jgi:hypothetical protein
MYAGRRKVCAFMTMFLLANFFNVGGKVFFLLFFYSQESWDSPLMKLQFKQPIHCLEK